MRRGTFRAALLCLLLSILMGTGVLRVGMGVRAQDALNLPADLYLLQNDGTLQRIGRGAAGIGGASPADTFVLDFAAHPDGVRVAFRTEDRLTLVDPYSSERYDLEGASAGVPPVRGRGDSMAWSPDGSVLAYTTETGLRAYFAAGGAFLDVPQTPLQHLSWSPDGRYLAAEAQPVTADAASTFWWVYRRDGEALTLAAAVPSSVGLAWYGNSALVFTPESGGVLLMDLANNNAQTTLAAPDAVYVLPFVRVDSVTLFFGKADGLLYFVAPDGAPTSAGVAPVDVSAAHWSPDGNLLLDFRGGTLAVVNPSNGQGFPLPFNGVVAFGWGFAPPPEVEGVELSADGYFLSDEGTGIAQVWRLPADGDAPFPFTSVPAPVTAFAVSRDGRRAAFVSGGALWAQDTDPDAEARQLTTFEGDAPARLAFNPDGREVAYALDGVVYAVALNGDDAPRALGAASDVLAYAPNIAALLVVDEDVPALLDPNAQAVTAFGLSGERALWLPGGGIAAYSARAVSVYDPNALDAAQARFPLPEGTTLPAVYALDGDTLRLVLVNWQVNVLDMDLTSGALTRVGGGRWMQQPQFSPDGEWLAGYRYVQGANGGPLTLWDVAGDAQVTLRAPGRAWAFVWGE